MKRLIAVFAIIAGSVFVAIPAALADDVPPPTDPALTTGDPAPAAGDPAPAAGDPAPAAGDPAPAAGDPAPVADNSAPAVKTKSSSKVKIAAGVAHDKVFVCKFVTTPGAGEILQTGDNPISVSISAILGAGPVVPGYSFTDAQGRSVVLAFDTGQAEPPTSACLPKEVTPEEPTTTPATCDHDGTLVLPTTEGVVYTVDPEFDGPGPYTVTATAVEGGFPGFVLAPDAQTVFDLTVEAQLTGAQCATPKKDKPDEPNGVLPNTGGAPLWVLLLGAMMTAGGVVLLRRPQPTPAIPSNRLEM